MWSKGEISIELLNILDYTKTVFIACYSDPTLLVYAFDMQLASINDGISQLWLVK